MDGLNAPVGVRQDRLGHEKAETTLGYTHAIGGDDRRVADEIGRILCPTLPRSSEVEARKQLPVQRDSVESFCSRRGRGTQVVRERSAKPLCVGSIPTRASSISLQLLVWLAVSPELTFRPGWASIGQNWPNLASGADKKRTGF